MYAYWVDSVILPYVFNHDETISFTYNPEHFDSKVVGSYTTNSEVYLMFPGNNWQTDDGYKFKIQDNGIYTLTLNWEIDVKPGFDIWNGYKFFIVEVENEYWLGANEYYIQLPESYAQHDGDRNFRIAY